MSTAVEGKSDSSNRPETHTPEPAASRPPTNRAWKHTLWYVGGAATFLAITAMVEYANRPAPIENFGKVGDEFYPDFVDPTLATSLELFVFDADSVQPVDFRVQRLDNGRWVIPSHHNYPADAEERLGKTASSIIGIERGALVTRWEADHSRYGVVNPQQESLGVDEVDGVGQRLILKKDDGSVLADYIIGKKVEGDEDQYYVRHPREDEVYITKLDIDLSTKFTDWIETKLFEFSNGEILRLTANDYSFNELNGQITERDVTTLQREKTWSEDWELDSLNQETEELNKDSIRDTVSAIADLEVIGVRPKQKGLTPDLQLDRNQITSQQGVDLLQQDLLARGFLLQPGENNALNLISREGELFAGTDDGLRYRMYFGRVFTGSQEELEIGFSAGSSSDDKADEENSAANGDASASSDEASESGDETTKPGRYLFVRVDFEKSLLGEEPAQPVEPEKPAALVAAEEAEASQGDSQQDASDSESSTDGEDAAAGNAEDASEGEEEASELEKLQEEFAAAQDQYREDLRAYEEYQEKVKEGLEKAEELNRRFADWYYVIPGESFDKLKLSREELVQPKQENEAADSSGVGEANTPLTDRFDTLNSPAESAAETEADATEPDATEPDATETDATAPEASEAATEADEDAERAVDDGAETEDTDEVEEVDP